MPSREELPIVLVGLRGSGKTTIGRLLARELEWGFGDLDVETARLACEGGGLPHAPAGAGELLPHGSSAGDLLAQRGVEVFRRYEHAALVFCLVVPRRIVLAAGGGVVELESNRDLLRERARCIWLHATPEVLAARVEADPRLRPPLVPGGALAEARALAAWRAPWFREVSNWDLDCSELTPEQATARLAERIRRDPGPS